MASESDTTHIAHLTGIAQQALEVGDYCKAEEAASAVLALTQRTESHHSKRSRARSRYILANVLEHKGDLAGAYALGEQTLHETKASDPENRTGNLALVTNFLGRVAHELGRLGEAVSLLEDALSQITSANPPHQKASILNNLALVLIELGDNANATIVLRNAKEELDHLPFPDDLQITWIKILVLKHLGICEWRGSGNPMAGLEDTWRAFKLTEQFFSDRPERLCVVLQDLAERVSLIESEHESLKEFFTMGEDNPIEIAQDLQDAGISFDKDYLEWLCSIKPSHTEQMFNRVMDLAKKAYPTGHTAHLQPLHHLARFKMHKGDVMGASKLYEEAMSMWEARPNAFSQRLISGALVNFASCLQAQERHKEALELVEKLLRNDEDVLETGFLSSSESQRLFMVKNLQGHLDYYLWLIWSHFRNDTQIVLKAFEILLRRQGIAATASLASKQVLNDYRQQRFQSRINRVHELQRLIADAELRNAKNTGTYRKSNIQVWHHEKQRLEAELARESPEIVANEHKWHITHYELVKKLGKDSVLVQCKYVKSWNKDVSPIKSIQSGHYSKSTERYLAFIVMGGTDSTPRLVDIGDGKEIENLISSFVTEVRGNPTENTPSKSDRELLSSEAGKTLSTRILKPILSEAPHCGRIHFVPDGQLTLLPIEVLPYEGNYVLDQCEIRYLSFGRDLLRARAKEHTHVGQPLVVCAPDFDLGILDAVKRWWKSKHPKELLFPRLSYTKAEGNSIVKLLRKKGVDAEIISGCQATKSRVMGISSPLVLHLATHGMFVGGTAEAQASVQKIGDPLGAFPLFSDTNPYLRSLLALAGANQFLDGKQTLEAVGNGLLTAEEVTTLELSGTEMVVLSACDTGRGMPFRGEGVFGLRRAFEVAGAKSVVMSLWHVADDTTMTLMEIFYEHLLAGESRTVALREAKLNLKRRGAHPWTWAAFICVGDAEPIPWNIKMPTNT